MLHSGDFRPRDAKLRQASSTTVRPTTRLLCTAALTLPGALLAQKVHPDEFKLKPQIDKAIAGGVEHLLDTQVRDGSWGVVDNQLGGLTGLCAYALLKSGVSPDHPSLVRAFGFLDGVTPTLSLIHI